MKLLNHLFEIVDISSNSSRFSAVIKIARNHIVFKGHFPGYPVTPGVILLQIVHELIEEHLGKKMRLIEMSNCKFLKVVSPDKGSGVIISIDFFLKEGFHHVKAVGKNTAGVFLKLSAVYSSC